MYDNFMGLTALFLYTNSIRGDKGDKDMKLRKNLSGRMSYQSFIPPKISEYEYIGDDAVLSELAGLFAELKTMVGELPESEVRELVSMEAYDSWRLSEEKAENSFSLVSAKGNENADNIVKATLYGAGALDELPISTRMIRNIHYLICEGEDYDRKYRGEYRSSPVWIGDAGASIANAAFMPPVGEDMVAAISDLDNYINYGEANVLIKSAIIHYQFEMIHPFIDGNGRTGRVLNSLFLLENGAMTAPVLLLSHILSRNYNRYCNELQRVNETGYIAGWIRYWLATLMESAKYTLRVVKFSDLG